MLIFGIVGYLMKKFDYEGAPLVLAFVLGPMMENNLRKSLIMSQGDFSIFFTRPVSLILVVSIVLLILGQLGVFGMIRSRFKKSKPAAA